jgi:hypothetical protein
LIELTTPGCQHASVELNRERAVELEAIAAGFEELAVVAEAVARCIDCMFGLIAAWGFRVVPRSCFGVVGQIRDDKVELPRHRFDEIAEKHAHLPLEALSRDVVPGECDGSLAVVGSPDAGRRRAKRDGDCHGTRAGADIRHPN